MSGFRLKGGIQLVTSSRPFFQTCLPLLLFACRAYHLRYPLLIDIAKKKTNKGRFLLHFTTIFRCYSCALVMCYLNSGARCFCSSQRSASFAPMWVADIKACPGLYLPGLSELICDGFYIERDILLLPRAGNVGGQAFYAFSNELRGMYVSMFAHVPRSNRRVTNDDTSMGGMI